MRPNRAWPAHSVRFPGIAGPGRSPTASRPRLILHNVPSLGERAPGTRNQSCRWWSRELGLLRIRDDAADSVDILSTLRDGARELADGGQIGRVGMGRSLDRHLIASAPAGGFSVAPMSRDENRAFDSVIADYRAAAGFKRCTAKLVTLDNAKLSKSLRPSYGLSLAPAATSGVWNVCPWSTPGCRGVCLASAGNGRYDTVTRARSYRTLLLGDHPAAFIARMADEIRALVRKVGPINYRPNIVSDLRWELFCPGLMDIPGVALMDYTKAPTHKRASLPNYRLVGSVSERDDDETIRGKVDHYGSAAVALDLPKGAPLPVALFGRPVVDGDLSDDRTLGSELGVVVGLRFKRPANGATAADSHGFVRAVG